MRRPLEPRTQFCEVDISAILLDERSRDDIPRLLRGLQHIYLTPSLRDEVFSILEGIIPDTVNRNTGRPGMDLWRILVLGTMRVGINCDYDRLLELANEHATLRRMLGHGPLDEHRYRLTVRDNIALFTPEILDRINQAVVKAGHGLVKKKTIHSRRVVTPSS